MAGEIVTRPAEFRVIAEFLTSAAAEPSALVVEGEPGIGKTTLWLAATDLAAERGFQVLTARPVAAESVLAYASLGDMLRELDVAIWADLPARQRSALERVLSCTDGDEFTDQHAVSAGLLSVVKGLTRASPVLLAIDDLQWLDSASKLVVAFVARRLPRGAGVLCTVRTGPAAGPTASWLQLRRPDALRRVELAPLGLGGLREILSRRLGRSFSRPAMVQIHDISRGNPFYALELAMAMDDEGSTSRVQLPNTLAELVRTRIDVLDTEVRNALLAASCVSVPTVELVAAATAMEADCVVGLLTDAADHGIVEIDGHTISFTHPLLARGVYDNASYSQRRAMHRRLAEIVEEPELQARHLALAVAWGEPHALTCLDTAARAARQRGAPAAAAELVDLAISLGGDSIERRISSASYHFDAGDCSRARELLKRSIAGMAPGARRAQALGLLGGMEILEGSLADAAALLQGGLADSGDDLALRAQILMPLSLSLFNVGDRAAAAHSVDDAVACATRLGHPHTLSQALGMQALLGCWLGRGFDDTDLQRALELEDRQAAGMVISRPSMHNGMLLAFTGKLEKAAETLRHVALECRDRGEDIDELFADFHRVLVEIWRGDFARAASIAEDAVECAPLLNGDLPFGVAQTMRQVLAAYAGNERETRRDGAEAFAALQPSNSSVLTTLPTAFMGFLEISLGDYKAAVTTLEPLLSRLDPALEGTEIMIAGFLPDLIEAMIKCGRLDDSEPLIDALERNGVRLGRPWMLAVGGRCRAMLLAASGDVHGAALVAQAAMAEHARLPMPFERARTQLLVGQLQRRLRHRDAAAATLRDALGAFERMGTPLWADRARAQLACADVRPGSEMRLTESEQRVAQLAASGMTNRDVAAALFISPKTVESNLVRIYRKLGIHSRAELGRVIGRSEEMQH